MIKPNKDKPGSIIPVEFESTNHAYKNSIWKTNEGYNVKVLNYIDKYNVVIQFEDGFIMTVSLAALRAGSIKNPFKPNKHGAYFGYGDYTKRYHIKIYTTWSNIFKRLDVENQINNSRNNVYKNVSICEEWYNYQNFAQWYDIYISSLNPDLYDEYQIDKDILQWELEYKIYSPQTCCLVPKQINLAFSNLYRDRIKEPDLPMGVHKNSNKYSINISIGGSSPYIGNFDTASEAFEQYKYHKEKYLHDIAKYYLSINAIHKDIYDAICRIEIKPFKN